MSCGGGWKVWFILSALCMSVMKTSYGQTWHGGGEVLFMKPTISGEMPFIVQSDVPQSPVSSFSIDADRDYDPAFRVWLGRVADDGGTLRGRFWHYDHSVAETYTVQPGQDVVVGLLGVFEGIAGLADNAGDVATWQHRLKAYTCDLEMGQILQPSFGRFHVGGGVRAAGLTTQLQVQINQDSTVSSEMERIGVGPTVFAEYERSIFQPLTLFASTRSAILMSQSKNSASDLDQNFGYRFETDVVGWQQETRFGFNFLRAFESHDLVASTFLEHQYWSNGQSLFDSSLGFFGVGIQLGFVR